MVELENRKLMKLKDMEAHLIALLEKVDQEINQTDVEWLQLRSHVKLPEPSGSFQVATQQTQPVAIPQSDVVDNNAQLNLNVAVAKPFMMNPDEEFDSD